MVSNNTPAARSATGLPPGVEAAWGLRERQGKGRKPGLSIERIVRAALDVTAAEGLPAVTMGRVAAELGVSTMALYRYVSSKDDLLVLMEDAAAAGPPADPPEGESWRDGLTRWAWAYRELLHRNLWILRIPVSTPPVTPNSVAWMEQGLRCLAASGLAPGARLGVLNLVSGYVRSEASLTADLEDGARSSGLTLVEATAAYGLLLGRLTGGGRYPAVSEVLDSGVLGEPFGPEEDFAFGLGLLLDGVEVHVTKGQQHG
ncbi:TetR/AcrR family transcriptional regulator [Streptomyces sp. 549]|uniref:TetR/AcrR family transcriptional regulator n=1 Tax=Streptomyces sp. 549 TaxID=3049076 RepID=UPI0024C3A736|nr:TetR/AcrR family transcriptional regulator [Streptomyces sp. 549]MDK1471974.1 TetR/AcrR family transcriptional regulator [Streptomyces sp. 549]